MAEYLASIFGTEKDKVNCSFYFKIGACRHGERCSRLHNKPTFSQTILLTNMYIRPTNTALSADGSHVMKVDDVQEQQDYDDFFEEIFVELEKKYGVIEEMHVCDNLGDHLVGNVYVRFKKEEAAERAVKDLNDRWFDHRPIHCELSPVTDFGEACCRQYDMGECTRGGFCNFMHIKPISRELERELFGRGGGRRSWRSRSPSKKFHRKGYSKYKDDFDDWGDRGRQRDRYPSYADYVPEMDRPEHRSSHRSRSSHKHRRGRSDERDRRKRSRSHSQE